MARILQPYTIELPCFAAVFFINQFFSLSGQADLYKIEKQIEKIVWYNSIRYNQGDEGYDNKARNIFI
jgi:hypothetical protein